MLRAVFFDLDETLIDAAGCHHEASHRAFAKFGMDWDEALVRSFAPMAKTDCLVVEDSSVGVTAGIAAGLPVCLVPLYPLAEEVRPDYTLTSLTEFPTLVARLAND